MQLAVQQPVEQQVNNALFPRLYVEGTVLAVEVVVQRQCRTKPKRLPLQSCMQRIEPTQAVGGKIIEGFAVSGGGKRLAPVKQRLGVNADRGAAEFSLAVHMAPAQGTGQISCGDAGHLLVGVFCTPKHRGLQLTATGPSPAHFSTQIWTHLGVSNPP